MSVAEVEKLALSLAERERAELAANLLHSLPPTLSDADEGVAEARRRDAELIIAAVHPISLSEVDSEIERRRD